MLSSVASLLVAITIGAADGAAETKTPILYSTDLFHPHEDPDDH